MLLVRVWSNEGKSEFLEVRNGKFFKVRSGVNKLVHGVFFFSKGCRKSSEQHQMRLIQALCKMPQIYSPANQTSSRRLWPGETYQSLVSERHIGALFHVSFSYDEENQYQYAITFNLSGFTHARGQSRGCTVKSYIQDSNILDMQRKPVSIQHCNWWPHEITRGFVAACATGHQIRVDWKWTGDRMAQNIGSCWRNCSGRRWLARVVGAGTEATANFAGVEVGADLEISQTYQNSSSSAGWMVITSLLPVSIALLDSLAQDYPELAKGDHYSKPLVARVATSPLEVLPIFPSCWAPSSQSSQAPPWVQISNPRFWTVIISLLPVWMVLRKTNQIGKSDVITLLRFLDGLEHHFICYSFGCKLWLL